MKPNVLYLSKYLLIEYNKNVHSCWGDKIQLKQYDESDCFLLRIFTLFVYFGQELPYI